MALDLDIVIISIFLIANLAVGLSSGRNIGNIRQYSLGDRNFKTSTLVATIVATWMMGNTVAINAFETYDRGLFFLIPSAGDVIAFFIIAYCFVPRMGEFLGKLSIADAMGGLYGNKVRAVTAVSAIMPAIGVLAIQFSVLTLLLSHFLEVSNTLALGISGLVVTIYSTFGGIKAVTFTDMIQFATFGVICPIIIFLMWHSIDSSDAVFNVLTQNSNFDFKTFFNFGDARFIDAATLFLFFLIPGMDPTIFQRISMSKNISQAKRCIAISGFIMLLLYYAIFSVFGLLLLADNAQNLTQDTVVTYIMDNYLSTGFKGLFVIGVMALVMSTTDSYINSSAIMISHDLREAFSIQLSEKKELLLARIVTFIIGIFGMLLSLFSHNIIDMFLMAYSFYMPIVSVPFICALYGVRPNTNVVLSAMFAGFTMVIAFKAFSDIDSLLPGMAANLIVLMTGYLFINKRGGNEHILPS